MFLVLSQLVQHSKALQRSGKLLCIQCKLTVQPLSEHKQAKYKLHKSHSSSRILNCAEMHFWQLEALHRDTHFYSVGISIFILQELKCSTAVLYLSSTGKCSSIRTACQLLTANVHVRFPASFSDWELKLETSQTTGACLQSVLLGLSWFFFSLFLFLLLLVFYFVVICLKIFPLWTVWLSPIIFFFCLVLLSTTKILSTPT